MELAFVERPSQLDVLWAPLVLIGMAYLSTLALFLSPELLLPHINVTAAVAIATITALVQLVYRGLYLRDLSARPLVKWALAPLLFLIALPLLSYSSTRFVAGTLACLIMIAVFTRFGAAPVRFTAEYLLTHPRLTAASRKVLASETSHLVPDLRLLIPILLAALFLPLLSPLLAMLAIIVACFLQLRPWKRTKKLRLWLDVIPAYWGYGMERSGAPGVWIPSESLAARRLRLQLLTVPLFIALAICLSLFFPWDVFRSALPRQYHSADLASVFSQLRSVPWAWLGFVYDKYLAWYEGKPNGSLLYVWSIPVAFSLSLAIPGLILSAVYRRSLTALAELRDRIEQCDLYETDEHGRAQRDPDNEPRARPEWRWYADRIRNSAHSACGPEGQEVREANHLFLGVEPYRNFPILLDRAIVAEHCYITGESGAGKTSMGVLPMLLQLLRPYRLPDGSPSAPPPLLIIDLKGDPALFHTLREEVEGRHWVDIDASGKTVERCGKFLYFTLEKGFASDRFNPLSSLDPKRRTLTQLCQIVLDSLDLNHGAGYGRSYYTARSRQALHLALKHVVDRRGQAITFQNLQEALLSRAAIPDASARKEAFQLLATIQALMEYPQLQTTPDLESQDPTHVIHMPRVLEERQVVYFWLPTIQESISVREVGQLALYAFLSAAIDRQRAQALIRQSYLVIDEFQSIASRGFKPVLQQARQFGVGAILANQTPGDLDTPDGDLRPTVRTNTRLKLYYALSDVRDVQDLIETSGEEVMVKWSMSKESIAVEVRNTPMNPPAKPYNTHTEWKTRVSSSWAQELKPRFTVNDIAAISDHPHDFVAHVTRGSGYTQFGGLPFFVRSTWPITFKDYQRRSLTPWPKPEGSQVHAPREPGEVDRGVYKQAEEAHARQQEELEKAFAKGAKRTGPKGNTPETP